MSVILNEVALRALLDSQDGPVMEDVEQRAQAATEAFNQRIAQIISNPFVRPQAGYVMTPEGAVIGIRDQGKVSGYMDAKLARENWWEAVGRAAAS